MSSFHVQARLVRHEQHRVVHDEVRLADTDSRDEDFRIAHDLVRDGFTVWIWAKVTRPDGRGDLDLVETLRPTQPRSPPAAPGRYPRARPTGDHRV